AEVHRRQRLAEQDGLANRIRVRCARPTLRDERFGRRQFERHGRPPGELVEDVESHVVPRALVSRSRVAESENRLQSSAAIDQQTANPRMPARRCPQSEICNLKSTISRSFLLVFLLLVFFLLLL